jgi:hypothetical protein
VFFLFLFFLFVFRRRCKRRWEVGEEEGRVGEWRRDGWAGVRRRERERERERGAEKGGDELWGGRG